MKVLPGDWNKCATCGCIWRPPAKHENIHCVEAARRRAEVEAEFDAYKEHLGPPQPKSRGKR